MSEDKINNYSESALHRSNLYFFLSSIFLRPPTKDTIKTLSGLKGFCEFSTPAPPALPDFLSMIEGIDGKEFDAIVQEYHDLFKVPLSKYVAPYESVYRDGCLGGQSALSVKEIYGKLGFKIPHEYYELPDHIGIELAFLATLCREEYKAGMDKDTKLVASLKEMEGRFLKEHIVSWLPKLCEKIRKKANGNFYPEIAKITLDFVQSEDIIF